jgi:hypothetical protein
VHVTANAEVEVNEINATRISVRMYSSLILKGGAYTRGMLWQGGVQRGECPRVRDTR